MRGNQRILVIVAAVVVVVVAFIIISPGGDDNNDDQHGTTDRGAARGHDEHARPRRPARRPQTANTVDATVKVVNAKPEGGIQTINAKKGQTLHLTVESDTADEIHVHGYDVQKDVEAGGTVTFNIPLTIDGIFVIELESRGEQIAKLVVQP